MAFVTVTRIGRGVYRVEHQGRRAIVYVSGRGADRWAFWEGRVIHDEPPRRAPGRIRGSSAATGETLEAPMPARVVQVLVSEGATVKKGDTVVLLEAMKMELPIRAPGDLKVVAVRCREGELVQANQPLVELE